LDLLALSRLCHAATATINQCGQSDYLADRVQAVIIHSFQSAAPQKIGKSDTKVQ
jgi:hypothetical protein